MSDATAELVARGVGAIRRSSLWWAIGIVSLAVVTAASWPSFEGTEALESFDDMGDLLEAFGAENIATPAGYLDGQLFALMLPLLLSGLSIATASALTAGDEDAGRLELLHALPVARTTVWLARWASSALMVGAVGALVAAVTVAVLPLFSLEEVGSGRVGAATLGCAVLALFHGAVAYAVAGVGLSRGRSVGTAGLVLVAGYVASFLLPLNDRLAGMRKVSPWYWALGGQPVSDGIDAAAVVLLTAVTIALVALGTIAVGRRDIRSA
jgi:ABC-2 type transport system permease protein